MTTSKHVRYSGNVQGVGFRYTARHLADAHPGVGGYVRNLSGGDVELVAEGPPGQVEAFLAALGKRMARYIHQTAVRDESPGGYAGFTIRT